MPLQLSHCMVMHTTPFALLLQDLATAYLWHHDLVLICGCWQAGQATAQVVFLCCFT